MKIDDKKINVTGNLIKTARIRDEWYEDVDDPASFIEKLKKTEIKADIFTFWQRLPETEPKYTYYKEWDSIAAIPIKSFDYWFENQINCKTRNMVRKAKKKGIEIREVSFDDEFIKGLVSIFNETPTRQGKLFWHYGMDFDNVKQTFSRNIYREDIVGAYYNNELIGFIMLADAGKYAILTQILSKIEHRDKAPNNALMAKAVEICETKKLPYLTYAYWPRSSLADFKRNNGFEKIDLPRYYVPITLKGMIVLKLRLQKGVAGILPKAVVLRLIDLRTKWYSRNVNDRAASRLSDNSGRPR